MHIHGFYKYTSITLVIFVRIIVSEHRCTVYVDAKYTEMHSIHRCTVYIGAQYTQMHSIHRCKVYRDAQYTQMHSIHRCTVYIDSRYTQMQSIQRCTVYIDTQYTQMPSIHRCTVYIDAHKQARRLDCWFPQQEPVQLCSKGQSLLFSFVLLFVKRFGLDLGVGVI